MMFFILSYYFFDNPESFDPVLIRSVRVAERLALPTSGYGVAGSNPAGGEILPEPKRRFDHCTELFMFILPSSRSD